jgi:hypothetical protein
MTHRHLLPVLAFVCALLVAGCDGGKKLYPVTGSVTYKGKAPVGALVVFHPKGNNTPQVIRPSGVVKEDGTYTLTSGGTDADAGAPAGEYDIVVTWDVPPKKVEGMGGGEVKVTTDQLGGRYQNPAQSGLKATVNAGATQVPAFDLK